MAAFEDASNDATGPGGYTPPGDGDFRDGDFDLRRLTVSVDGEDVLFEVTLGAPFRTPLTTTRSGSTPVLLLNGIALQNLDLYLDTDPTPGAGSSACIPGRRVAFAGGRTWEAAVVFTPQPGPARAVTRDALGGAADHVIFVDGLQVLGRTVTARVPAALLGGPPRPDWGYSLHLSGAAWERTFALGSRLRGTRQPDAFTLPVLPVPEAWAFGGGAMGEVHPRVVDVLLPAGADQGRILGSYDEASGAFARVPFLLAGSTPGGALLAPEVAATATSTNTASSMAAHPERSGGEADAKSRGTPTATPTAAPTPSTTPPGAGTPLPGAALSSALMPHLAPSSAATPAGKPSAAGAGALVVVDVTDELVSARGPVAGLQPMQFGRVLDAQGATVARVMILRVLDQGVLASAIAGKERIARGATLLFDAAPVSP